jgi:peptidoglycan lytic transglycosylase
MRSLSRHIALAAILIASCKSGGGPTTEGIASYYHNSLAGRPTASGAKYDPTQNTCAHRTLPFGSEVEIEDVKTGRTARCVINDRGPYAKGRLIDMSRSVAEDLGVYGKRGVAKVKVRVLSTGSGRRKGR